MIIDNVKLNLLLKLAKTCCNCAKKHFNSKQYFDFNLKIDNSPVTKADLEVNKIATEGLKKIFPNDTIISEESSENKLSYPKEKFWLIDPIDGTKEFLNGSENFTVNFGLIFMNKSIFGLIAQPCTDTVWYSFKNKSWKIIKTFKHEDSVQIKTSKFNIHKLRLIASKNHSNTELENWIKLIKPKEQINIGSSLKFCKMAEGKIDIYPRNLPTMEWDTAAGHSILKYAGGNIFTKNGLELHYGKANLKNSNFLAVSSSKTTLPVSFYLGDNLFDLKSYNKEINNAVNSLNKSQLVAFPTETVYGLGAKGYNVKAINAIYKVKKRPKNNPLIAHVLNKNIAKTFVNFTKISEKLTKHFWPGPLTIVLQTNKDNELSNILSQGKSSLAIRVPSHPVALDLIKKLNSPILAPSANKSGKISSTSAKHVKNDFKKLNDQTIEIANILDFGNFGIGLESTVVDCRGKNPIILREGFITAQMIEYVIKSKVIDLEKTNELLSPGMLSKHYSPKTKLLINQKKYIEGSGCLTFGKVPKEFLKVKNRYNLSSSGNLFQAAELLYEGLRYLDKLNLKFIQVLPIPNYNIGKAINDRLNRASNEK